ncbi:MAG: glycosyltransferase [Candidatus Erginobacter occultus]|nr:glycosyltransferase [Candidatus Erginobacter occultus]
MIIFAGILLLWLLGFIFLFRVPRCRAGGEAIPAETISVIIPARNEAANLPGLLESLALQEPPPGEVIVVDDGSEDATAQLAEASGARVLPSRPLPEGWRGKTWACQQGAGAARGEVLLFIDADTRLRAGGLDRWLAEFRRTGGALSLLPYHIPVRPYEELSAFFHILMAAGVGAFTIFGRKVRSGLFGPSLMISREDYFRGGGHETVRGEILENFFLAESLRRAGVETAARGGKGVLTTRMYPGGLGQLISGWTKAFAAGAAGTPPPILALTGLWLSGAFAAPGLLLLGGLTGLYPYPAAGILYLLYALQVFSMLRRLGNYSPLTALLYPIGLVFYIVVFSRSLLLLRRGSDVEWKGRRIGNEPGRGNR